MAEALKVPFTLADVNEAPQPLRLFYQRQPDGTFALQTEGAHPDSAKLAEFRDSNRSLNAQVTTLLAERDKHAADLAALTERYKDVDPDEYRALKARPDPTATLTALETAKRDLEAALDREKAAHAQTQFRNTIGLPFLQHGGEPAALDFIVTKAAQTFSMHDGKVTTAAFSATHPGVPLSVEEWMTTQLQETAFAFKPSRGGGAEASRGVVRQPVRPTVSRDDVHAFGQHLEAIARGDVDVR